MATVACVLLSSWPMSSGRWNSVAFPRGPSMPLLTGCTIHKMSLEKSRSLLGVKVRLVTSNIDALNLESYTKRPAMSSAASC